MSDTAVTGELFAMDTYMTLKAYGEHAEEAIHEAKEQITALDELLSTENAGSEIYRLNEQGKLTLSEVPAYLFERSVQVHELTLGAFNPLIYPLMQEWGFTDKDYHVPSAEKLSSLLSLTDISKVDFDPETGDISFRQKGMKIDFGGIAKGYTSARVMDVLKENGVKSAVVSLGGNVQVLGAKPDGSLWRIAIRDPVDSTAFLGTLNTRDQAVITSGGYERYFEENGKTYHHILDPSTGSPADSGLISVTIVSEDGTLADALSTALYVAGPEKASEIWRAHSDLFDAIFVTDDGLICITEGIEKAFTTDREFRVIKK